MEEVLLVLVVLLSAALFVLCRLTGGRRRLYLPDAFVFAVFSHVAGATWLWTATSTPATRFVLTISAIAFVSATASATLCLLIGARGGRAAVEPGERHTQTSGSYKLSLLLLTGANILIAAALFMNAGIRLPLVAAFTASDTTLLVARKAITASTEGYMSPGLIKLARDIAGPIIISAYILSSPTSHRSLGFWISVIILMFTILIGGQRFPMMVLYLAMAASFAIRPHAMDASLGARISPTLFYAAAILLSFSVTSILLGRSSPEEARLLDTVGSLFDRIFIVAPADAVRTYHYWHNIGPTGGSSWVSDLMILMPGADSSFASRLHSVGGGSAEGNAPLFFAADAWLAFGQAGVIASCLIFTIVLHLLDRILWSYRSPTNDACRIVMFLYIPMMYSPYLFLLYGGLVVGLVVSWTISKRLLMRDRRNSSHAEGLTRNSL